MKTEHVADLLVALGLAIQILAILGVLRSLGILRELRLEAARRIRGARSRIGKYLPFVKPKPRKFTLNLHDQAHASDSVDGYVTRPTDRPPPKDLGEVGDRLNEMQEALNRHDKELVARAAKSRGEVAEAKTEAQRQQEKLEEAIRAEAAKQLRERRREGSLLIIGGALQLSGAVLLLAFT